jgi:capsular polysaccharide biosynthesis protein
MELAQFYQLIRNGKKTILLSVLVFLLFASAFTFLRPLEYRAQSRLLIIQNSQEGTDPFVAAKANEYLGGVLTKIVSSNSFLDEVLGAGLNVDRAYFSNSLPERAKTWQSMVSARSFGDLGVIEISVFHPDKYQAEQVAQAIDLTLKNKSNTFLSTGDKVEIKVIDQPTVSKWPVRPNIVLNMILGPVIGLIFSLFYLYLFAKVSVEPVASQMPAFVPAQSSAEPQPAVRPAQEPVWQPAQEPAAFQQPPREQPAAVAQPRTEQAAVVPEAGQPAQPPIPAAAPVAPAAPIAARPPVNNDFDLDDILNQGNISNLL